MNRSVRDVRGGQEGDRPGATPLRVLFVASECAPFAKTGGLGEVIGSLPQALRRRGVDVRVAMPLYAGMAWQQLEPLEGALAVPMWFGAADAHVRLSRATEPCGLSHLNAMRYGTLPIVRATGGLVDTVTSYEEESGEGTGFVLHDLRADSLADTIGWAVSTWYDRPAHIERMRRRAMARDHSWDRSARQYVDVYVGEGMPSGPTPRLLTRRARSSMRGPST